MRYVVPVVVDWPGTVIAVNVGGALIPGLMSLYLLVRNKLWGSSLVATAGVTWVCHGTGCSTLLEGVGDCLEGQHKRQWGVGQAKGPKPLIPLCCALRLGIDQYGHAADLLGNG